jgi:hypothetical protein
MRSQLRFGDDVSSLPNTWNADAPSRSASGVGRAVVDDGHLGGNVRAELGPPC